MISSILTKLFATFFMAYEKTQDEEKLTQSTELTKSPVAQSRMTEHTFHPSWALGMGAPLQYNNLWPLPGHRFHPCIQKLPSLQPTLPLFRATVVESWSYKELRRKQIPSSGTLYGIFSVLCLAGRNVEGKRFSFTKQSYWMTTDRNYMEADFL